MQEVPLLLPDQCFPDFQTRSGAEEGHLLWSGPGLGPQTWSGTLIFQTTLSYPDLVWEYFSPDQVWSQEEAHLRRSGPLFTAMPCSEPIPQTDLSAASAMQYAVN